MLLYEILRKHPCTSSTVVSLADCGAMHNVKAWFMVSCVLDTHCLTHNAHQCSSVLSCYKCYLALL
jgi:hypothetical protein